MRVRVSRGTDCVSPVTPIASATILAHGNQAKPRAEGQYVA